ncbi:hypothetical protein, partial [Streptomyces sp. NPDC058572]|uniref:hypothetical protein n=1 Tax=Streptomyces sp. NPDC058572 TaxID=3346546 RepID=UPI00365FE741
MARAARLLPAQLLMLLGLSLLLHILPNRKVFAYIDMVRSSVRVLTSTEDQFVVETLCQHAWSLAVEEWSYVFLSLLIPWFPSNVGKRTKVLLSLLSVCWLAKVTFHFIKAGEGLPWYGTPYLGIPPLNFNWRYGTIPNMAKILLGSAIRLCPAPSFLSKPNVIVIYSLTALLFVAVYPLDQYIKI